MNRETFSLTIPPGSSGLCLRSTNLQAGDLGWITVPLAEPGEFVAVFVGTGPARGEIAYVVSGGTAAIGNLITGSVVRYAPKDGFYTASTVTP